MCKVDTVRRTRILPGITAESSCLCAYVQSTRVYVAFSHRYACVFLRLPTITIFYVCVLISITVCTCVVVLACLVSHGEVWWYDSSLRLCNRKGDYISLSENRTAWLLFVRPCQPNNLSIPLQTSRWRLFIRLKDSSMHVNVSHRNAPVHNADAFK